MRLKIFQIYKNYKSQIQENQEILSIRNINKILLKHIIIL